MRIFLIGYMGAGKSTAGRKLSGRLKHPFIDTDTEFEVEYGIIPAEAIDTYGEAHFREREHRLFRKLVDASEDFVMATGGGLPCFYNHMELMNRYGISVYIRMSPKSLFHRLSDSPNERPLLKSLKGEELIRKITHQLILREDFYNRADLIVKGENLDISNLIKEIEKITEEK
jgi:shikimate kinase